MKPKLSCPHARHDARMYIECIKREEPCAHQRWCMSKGWAILTDKAGNCPARKDDDDERAEQAAARHSDAV